MSCAVRLARAADAEAMSVVIQRALRETNAGHYPPPVLEALARGYSTARLLGMMEARTVFVAVVEDRIVGTASFDGRAARAVFVVPGLQGRGVGTRLMAAVESAARERGVAFLAVESSITAEPFYARLGYAAVRDHQHGDQRTIIMERPLGVP